MDKYLEILITHYGFACQIHERVLRDSDQFSPHGSSGIQDSSARMISDFKAIEKYLSENYKRKT